MARMNSRIWSINQCEFCVLNSCCIEIGSLKIVKGVPFMAELTDAQSSFGWSFIALEASRLWSKMWMKSVICTWIEFLSKVNRKFSSFVFALFPAFVETQARTSA